MSEPSRTPDPLAADEARRMLRHDAVKANVEDDVNAEIAAQASQPRPSSAARKIEQVAGTFREHAVDEVIDSEHVVRRSRGVARVSQFIDYAFFLIYALLAMRFVLTFIAARGNSGFVRFIVSVTEPLYAPFKSIVASPKVGEGYTLPLPLLIAIGAYLVLHIAINRLLRVISVRKTEL
jgi:YGGT family